MVELDVLAAIRAAAEKQILFLPHAVRQMSRPGRMITPKDVERVVMTGELIEDYPEDVRGHSCLVLGYTDAGGPVHVVCAPQDRLSCDHYGVPASSPPVVV